MKAAHLPRWSSVATSDVAGKSVCGRSNAALVHGENVRYVDEPDGSAQFVFVESAGEPGNSGTLMFGWSAKKSRPVPIGVYVGVTGDHGNLRFRGKVCPFPALDDMLVTNPVPFSDSRPRVSLTRLEGSGSRNTVAVAASVRLVKAAAGNYYCMRDGNDWPGVFVDHEFGYIGARDSGSCRAK